MARNDDIRFAIFTKLEDLRALQPEWQDLWLRAQRATPFQSPDWLLPIYASFTHQPFVVACRQQGRLVALLPLCFRKEAGKRKLLLAGVLVSDYLDCLVEEGADGPALVWSWLRAASGTWDECDFRRLPVDSPLLALGADPAWQSTTTPDDVCPVLDLTAGIAGLPAKIRHNLDYYRRRARRLGEVTCTTADQASFPRLMADCTRLYRLRRRAKGNPWLPVALEQFRTQAAQAFLNRGVLRLHVLHLNDKPIAATCGFALPQRAYVYFTGFDPDHASISPGTLLFAHAIEQAIGEGARSFDFLRGNERYKYYWGARDQPTYHRILVKR